MKTALAAAEQKASELRSEDTTRGNTTGGSTRNSGGGGGLGAGGFDLASLMNNPALMGMASQMMQSGAFNDIMNNPGLASM